MNRLRSLVTPPMAALLALALLVTPMVASSTELPPPAFHAFSQMEQNTGATVTLLTDAELATIEGGFHNQAHAQVQLAAIDAVIKIAMAAIIVLVEISGQNGNNGMMNNDMMNTGNH
jgi:hypothetical protein